MRQAVYVAVVFVAALYLSSTVIGWFSSDNTNSTQPPPTQIEKGFNLQALSGLVKQVRGGQELERRLNEKDGINNLDLDEDTQIDYIQVTEFDLTKNGVGYSLTVEPKKAEAQEIAEVTIQKNGDKAEIQIVGNEQIYGPNAIYNDSTEIERKVESGARAHHYPSYFFMHSMWLSPFGFGLYPPYYGFFPIRPYSMYQSRYASYQSNTLRSGPNSYQKNNPTSFNNKNKAKSAQSVRAGRLTKPTSSQRAFTANRNTRSGGFGQKKAVSQRLNNRAQGTRTSRSFGSSNSNRTLRSGGFGGGARSARSFGK